MLRNLPFSIDSVIVHFRKIIKKNKIKHFKYENDNSFIYIYIYKSLKY